ncbi:MmgE/PrpD family protein [Rhodococcus sp. 14C212]|uniref:MmgE/PrpD family protein n=1 Tax=Rhodococcus sp. 14C212 TaxID=2711209 RepID=UPI0013ECD7B3|nr:MmgE/PrpD family protein [Rhodococcus sp. 14C212]NGP07391.1 MmgE/PrpD family protein [Rhodococcus sp. 14C212]
MTVDEMTPAIDEDRTTRRLAAFAAESSFESLPKSVVESTKSLILDGIAVTAATYHTPMAKALYALKGDQGGVPEATLMVDGRKVPAGSAAYVHGQLSNLLDADETMHNRMHTVSSSVMTGLALAERGNVAGADLIAAIAAGYDLTARVGQSLKQFVPDGNGGLTYAKIWGFSWQSIGAAATAGRVIGLDAEAMTHALGQAYATTPIYYDLRRNKPKMRTLGARPNWHKYQLSGPIAESAVNAALLAESGWKANTDIFDEGSEFWISFAAPGADSDVLYDRLGERWFISETSIKPYPFCRFGHHALDLVDKIITEHDIPADDIDDILVRIIPHLLSEELFMTYEIDEGLKLMSSEPTAISLLANRVPAGPAWFDDELLQSDRIRTLARKVRHEVNPDWGPVMLEQMETQGFSARIPTEVTLRTRSGHTYTEYTEYAKGDPWSAETAFGFDDVADKTRRFLHNILPAARIEELIEAVRVLEGSTDISRIAKATVA